MVPDVTPDLDLVWARETDAGGGAGEDGSTGERGARQATVHTVLFTAHGW